MKQQLSKILILSVIMIGIFVAPLAPSLEKGPDNQATVGLQQNIAQAQTTTTVSIDPSSGVTQTGDTTATLNLVIDNTQSSYQNNAVTVVLEPTGTTQQIPITNNQTTQTVTASFTGLTIGTTYTWLATIVDTSTNPYTTVNGTNTFIPIANNSSGTTPINGNPTSNVGTGSTGNDLSFGCGATPNTWFRQCIVTMIYYLVYKPVSRLAELAANVLDFFIYYSTNSSSYSAGFVSTGWKSVRDIANIFFIIALLYVAIQTILGLGSNGKKMIASIIVVALLINFSLFFTEIIIDSTNILAKVFYNQITPQDANGKPLTDPSAQKSITVGLVDVFSPEQMMAQAGQANNAGQQFIILILGIIVAFLMIYIFVAVALLFVGRVAGLWLAMIFSPIAFASYTVPFNIPGFGHKEWWDNLLKQAFMAPIFIFFLYIILLFGKNLKLITYDANAAPDNITAIMAVIIPFFIVMMLLLKAKKLAVEYSGEIGAAINGAGSKVLGFAAGAVTGGAALALSSTIGRSAQRTANDEGLKAKAAAGDKSAQRTLEIANRRANRSYDIRQTGVGKQLGKSTGLNLDNGTGALGLDTKTLKGGRKAQVNRAKEEQEAKFKTYELSGDEAAGQNIRAKEAKSKNERAKQYEEDKKEAEKNANAKEHDFNEQEFKEAYEKGGNMSLHYLDKTVSGGSVEKTEEILDAKAVNEDRRQAFANSLIPADEQEKAKKAMQNFFSDWGNGMKKMVSTPGGIGTTLAVGAATGGLGIVAAPVTIAVGGLLDAMKKLINSDKEVVSSLRKGVDPQKGIIDELRKMNNNKDADYASMASKLTGASGETKK